MTTGKASTLAGAAFALRRHWPEYLMEAAGLGLFMVAACLTTVALEHPSSPVRAAFPDELARRAAAGAAMGLTAVALISSPWGQRSGAHMNPGVTLAFWTLGKIDTADALFYALFQFAGGIAGVAAAARLMGGAVGHPSVNYAVTAPGAAGTAVAWVAELALSFGLLLAVLATSNSRAARWTPYIAGALLAVYITAEAPLSGMSINPARTYGSAYVAGQFPSLWIYFTAPPLGMLLAARAYRARRGLAGVYCAKLHHHNRRRCIFRCNYGAL
ncbi:MAG: aquaporin [Bryobacteraceae bacterium]